MKIGVQGNDNTILIATQLQDRGVFRSGKAEFADMNRVDTSPAQPFGGTTRQSLVKQQFHGVPRVR